MRAEAALRLLRSDVPMPAQHDAVREYTPEEALLAAVLEDAIWCVRRYRDRPDSRLYREAREWLLWEQRGTSFSFQQVCTLLRLDPGCVRAAAGVR